MPRLDDALKAHSDGYIDDSELARISLEEGAISEAEYHQKTGTPPNPKTLTVAKTDEGYAPESPKETPASKQPVAQDSTKSLESTAESFLRSAYQETTRKAKAAASGTMGSVAGIGGAARKAGEEGIRTPLGFGSLIKSMGLKTVGESISERAQAMQKELMPPDPTFADQVASGFGSSVPFFLAGFGLQAGAMRLAAIAPRIAAWTGAGLDATLEAMVNAGDTYNQTRDRAQRQGLDPETAHAEATKNANYTFFNNIPANLVTDKLGIFAEEGGVLKRAFNSFLAEGSQEAAQEVIGNIALYDPVILRNVVRAGAIGGIVGGATGGVVGMIQPNDIDIQIKNGVPEDLAVSEAQKQLAGDLEAFNQREVDATPLVDLAKGMEEAPDITVVRPETGEEVKAPVGTEVPSQDVSRETVDNEPQAQDLLSQYEASGKQIDRVEFGYLQPDEDTKGFIPQYQVFFKGEDHPATVGKIALEERGLDVPAMPEAAIQEAESKFPDYKYGSKVLQDKQDQSPTEQPPAPPAPPGVPPAPPSQPSPEGEPSGGFGPDIDAQRAEPMLNEAAIQQAKAVEEGTALEPTKITVQGETGVTDLKPKIEMSERELLRMKFQEQARGAKAGQRFGAKVARAETMAKVRSANADVKTIKKFATDYLVNHLPPQVRGRFLVPIRDAKTLRNVAKIIVRADNAAEEIYHKDLVSDVKRATSKALESPNVAIDYKERIRNLMSAFELKGHAAETLKRIKSTQDFIAAQKAQGKDVEMPEAILNELEILARKPLAEISTKELEKTLDTVLLLTELGKTKTKSLRAVYEAQKERIKKEVVPALHPIEKTEKTERKPGQELTLKEETSDKINTALDFWQDKGLAILPMDVVIDMMDGSPGYTGPNYNLFKKTIDVDFGRYLDMKQDFQKPVQKLADELQLTDSNFERIGVYAIDQQKGGRQHLISQGLDEKFIDSINLSEKEMKLYKAMRDSMEKPYPQVSDLLRTLYNREIGKVENYFPFKTDFDAMSDIEVFQRLGDSLEGFGSRTKTTEQGFTQERLKGARQAVKLNAMEIFEHHMDDVAYLLAMQKDVKMLSEIANSKEYKDAAGEVGATIMSQWLDVVARKGGAENAKRIAFIDTLRKNVGAAVLGFRLSSALVQPSSLFDAAAQVGGKWVFPAFYDITTGKKYREFIFKNFPEVRERIGDDPSYADLSKSKLVARMQKAGFWALQELDALSAMSTALASYRKALKAKGKEFDFNLVDLDAVNQAQKDVRRTQSSPFFKDASLALSRGKLTGNKSVDKALLQFQSFPMNRWSFLRHDVIRLGLRPGKRAEAAAALTYLMAANAAETGIRYGTKMLWASLLGSLGLAVKESLEPDDDKLGQEFLKNVLQMFPFMGQAMSLAMYQTNPVPSMEMLKDLGEGAGRVIYGKKSATKIRGLVQLMQTAASMSGVAGASQIGQLVQMMIRDQKLIFPYASELSSLKAKTNKTPEERKRLNQLNGIKRVWTRKNKIYRNYLNNGNMEKAHEIAEDMIKNAEKKGD